MNTDGGYSDPDEDVLRPISVKYKQEQSPRIYIPTSSSGSPSPEPGRTEVKKRRRKGRTRPSQGDAVLISYLDPNRPDIAQEAAQRALNSASQSEAGEEEEVDGGMSGDGEHGQNDSGSRHNHQDSSAHAIELKSTARAALNDVVMDRLSPDNSVVPARLAIHGAADVTTIQNHRRNSDDATPSASVNAFDESSAPSRSLRPPPPLKIVAASSDNKGDGGGEESIGTSPALAKFAISAAEANPESTLPAMQKSPSGSASNCSPDGTQSLPSLKTTLSQIADTPIVETPNNTFSPFPSTQGQSPTMSRSPYIIGMAGPSPGVYSHPSPSSSKDTTAMSPPIFPNHSSCWHNGRKEGSFATTAPASVPALTPVAAYPTTKEPMSPEGSTTPQVLNGPLPSINGPSTSTSFQCSHPGCNAQPFQTQYLLNSHANVHSSDRPHYCSVKGCSRSIGGKGFKRKNEMIRHGLVHDSPGYMCPFCAEQRKYPRPDNLQRYSIPCPIFPPPHPSPSFSSIHRKETSSDQHCDLVQTCSPTSSGQGTGRSRITLSLIPQIRRWESRSTKTCWCMK